MLGHMPSESGHPAQGSAGAPAWDPEQVPPDVFSARCPSRAVLELIADKWAVLVAQTLIDGPKRHSELREHIDGISQKMLTRTLRQLEGSGLVERRIYAEVPPRVEYSLTELGRSLRQPVLALTDWAQANAFPVYQARRAHGSPAGAAAARS
jgi:DNA-binding HxlR family transcriptional regulator